MKTIFRHILVISISLLVTLATGGINLYKHYCLCTGQTMQSLFVAADNCQHQEHHPCCEAKVPAAENTCCHSEKENPPTGSHSCVDGHHCCNNIHYFYKTDQFDSSKSPKKSFKFLVAFQAIVMSASDRFSLTGSTFDRQNPEMPPIYFGIELLKHIHQFKISSPLV